MNNFQQNYLKIHIFNQLIGQHTFEFSPKDSISDLRNTICQTTQLLIYQNFHFQHDGKILSQFLQMGQILTNGSKVNIVFNSFDQRSSKFHYHKIKSILDNPNLLVSHHYPTDDNINRKQTDHNKVKIAYNIDDFQKALSNQQLLEPKVSQIEYKFSDLLNLSGFNPVPYYRKMMGDFYYIYFKSPQQIDYHITAHCQGFFVNQSTNSHFNPLISLKHQKTYISLLQVLYNISSKFNDLFKQVLKKVKFQQYQKFFIGPLLDKRTQWMRQNNKNNNIWKINTLQKLIKREEILTIKDWNQMFQIQHLQPTQSFHQRINRQKLKFKIYQEFVDHAKIGAINIVDKQIQPLNRNCPIKDQTFLFANIYFSFVQNSFQQKQLMLMKQQSTQGVKLSSKATKCPNNYILNLSLIESIQCPLHLSHVVLLSYKGYRLRAQSLPSSLLHTKPRHLSIQSHICEQNLINKPNISLNKQFSQNLLKLTFKLNLEYDHVVKDIQTSKAKKMIINHDIKGMQLMDRRKYIFGLEGLSPIDYNFINQNNQYYVIRPQLISIYNQKFKCKVPINTMLGRNYQKQQYQLYTQNQRVKIQQKKLRALAGFAKQNAINMFISSMQGQMKKYLADTKNIIQVLHKHGLNCRYLGLVLKRVNKKKSPHLQALLQKVIFIKCIKNIIITALKSTKTSDQRQMIAHLLNCIFYGQKTSADDYFTSKSTRQQQNQQFNTTNVELSKKTSKKKRNKQNKQKEKEDSTLTISHQQSKDTFLTIKPIQLARLVCKIAKIKYNHEFAVINQCLMPKVFNFGYGKCSVLRDICLNVGIILQKKDYFNKVSNTKSHPFCYQNILQFTLRCTHSRVSKCELQSLISQGDHFLAQFMIQQSIQSYNKAIQYILTTFGGNSPKLPIIHKKLSFIYFKIGDIQTALLFGMHSLRMFQEFYGKQHVETIDNLSMLGVYYTAERNFQNAQQYLFMAIYHSYKAYSQLYPQILILWMNLSTVYELQKMYAQAIMCLFEGLRISLKIFTQNHLNSVIYLTALASIHFQIPDILQAIKYKQKSLVLLGNIVPQNDVRIKQSMEQLQYYKSLQQSKKIKQIHQKQQRKLNNQWGLINGTNNARLGINNKFLGKEAFLKETEDFWKRNKRHRMYG